MLRLSISICHTRAELVLPMIKGMSTWRVDSTLDVMLGKLAICASNQSITSAGCGAPT